MPHTAGAEVVPRASDCYFRTDDHQVLCDECLAVGHHHLVGERVLCLVCEERDRRKRGLRPIPVAVILAVQ